MESARTQKRWNLNVTKVQSTKFSKAVERDEPNKRNYFDQTNEFRMIPASPSLAQEAPGSINGLICHHGSETTQTTVTSLSLTAHFHTSVVPIPPSLNLFGLTLAPQQ